MLVDLKFTSTTKGGAKATNATGASGGASGSGVGDTKYSGGNGATAGSIDDAVVAGDRVKLAIGASAVGTPSTGLAEFEIQYPFMDDATAA